TPVTGAWDSPGEGRNRAGESRSESVNRIAELKTGNAVQVEHFQEKRPVRNLGKDCIIDCDAGTVEGRRLCDDCLNRGDHISPNVMRARWPFSASDSNSE